MLENKTSEFFKLKRANSLAVLRFMSEQGIISYKVHFDLWRRLWTAKNNEDLDKTTSEILAIYQQGMGVVNG